MNAFTMASTCSHRISPLEVWTNPAACLMKYLCQGLPLPTQDTFVSFVRSFVRSTASPSSSPIRQASDAGTARQGGSPIARAAAAPLGTVATLPRAAALSGAPSTHVAGPFLLFGYLARLLPRGRLPTPRPIHRHTAAGPSGTRYTNAACP
jgi:hypothetical protein